MYAYWRKACRVIVSVLSIFQFRVTVSISWKRELIFFMIIFFKKKKA